MRGLHISTIFQDNSTDFLYSVCRIVQTNFQGTCNHLQKVCTFVHVFLKKSKYLECISAEGNTAEEISVEDISVEDTLARDISVEGISVEDISVEDISAEDISVKDISVEELQCTLLFFELRGLYKVFAHFCPIRTKPFQKQIY